jgi:hypothetical protein
VALRAVIRSRFVSVLAIVAFALGIAVTTAVFSIFDGVLLAPLPFPEPDRLVMVYDTQPACATCPASYPSTTTGANGIRSFRLSAGRREAQPS